jgi:hypothetical protein
LESINNFKTEVFQNPYIRKTKKNIYMKIILVALTLFICGNLFAQSNLSPKEFIKYYVKVFNEENIIEVQKCYHFPYSKIENGKIIYNDDENIPVIDYEKLKKAGWAHSKINDIKVIFESINTAVVAMDFSRFDKNDKQYFRTTVAYSLSKERGYWQIISGTIR